jgi:hypothetical protein
MKTFLFFFLNILAFLQYSIATNSTCPYDFKLYVYEIPSSFHTKHKLARQQQNYHVCKKCIFEQFSLEYILLDFFSLFCGRTYNPNEADYFYLPVVREIDYRISLTKSGDRSPSVIEETLLEAIEKRDMSLWLHHFNVTEKYWLKHDGADHVRNFCNFVHP